MRWMKEGIKGILHGDGNGRHGKEVDEAFGVGGVGEDGVAEGGVGEVSGDGELDGGEEFSGGGAETGEAEDLVGVGGDEGFEEAFGLAGGAGAEDGFHGEFEEAVGNAGALGFGFVEADAGEFGVDEEAGGDEAVRCAARFAGEGIADDAEVVEGDVGKVSGAGAIADGEDVGGGGLEVFVDLDVAFGGEGDVGFFEVEVVGVGGGRWRRGGGRR